MSGFFESLSSFTGGFATLHGSAVLDLETSTPRFACGANEDIVDASSDIGVLEFACIGPSPGSYTCPSFT